MTHSSAAKDGRTAVPMWIPTPDGHVFAWYHPSKVRGKTRRCAVLLCDPFGQDRMALHRTYRQMALRLADGGFPVLQVEYPGTCDSEGSARTSVRVETWLSSLAAAADRLKEWSGAGELALCGMLLGGTLAVRLAARRLDVTALVLWAPYLKGRAAVRAGIASTATAHSNPQGTKPSSFVEGDQEALGFLLTKGMIEDLQAIDLLQGSTGNVRNALILPRSSTSPEAGLARHLASTGTTVDLRAEARDDLSEILESSGAGYPARTTDDILAWLDATYPSLEATQLTPPPRLCPAEVVLHGTGGESILERVQFLGPDRGVFGIVSEPIDGEARDPAILLLNAGANARYGSNRNYTEWSRMLASRGHRVLRIDFRGLGDSAATGPDIFRHVGDGRVPPQEIIDALYRGEARADVRDAVAWLKARGAANVACVGLCAGGFQAFQAALDQAPVASLVMLNPLRFHDRRIEDSGGDIFEADRWRHLIDGEFALRKFVRKVPGLARRIVGRIAPAATRAGRTARRIARSFVTLTGRGVDVCIVYNENEESLRYLQHALKPVRARLESSGRFRIMLVSHADHVYSPLFVQEEVTRILLGYFGEHAGRIPAAPRVVRAGNASP